MEKGNDNSSVCATPIACEADLCKNKEKKKQSDSTSEPKKKNGTETKQKKKTQPGTE